MNRMRRQERPPAGKDTPPDLDFEADTDAPRSRAESSRRFPRERVAEAGRTGGELPDRDVTADDLSPETLLDDDPSRTPSARRGRDAADGQLDVVSEADIGAGTGRDEAELAQAEPVGLNAAVRLRARSDRHAHDARSFEPAGAAEAREREAQHARQSGGARPSTRKVH